MRQSDRCDDARLLFGLPYGFCHSADKVISGKTRLVCVCVCDREIESSYEKMYYRLKKCVGTDALWFTGF